MTSKLNRYFQFCICLFLIGSLKAQSITPAFRNYTTKDGLPSSEVFQIKQDRNGYIWLATDNGISRFNGNSFENYTYPEATCSRTFFGIYEDQSKRIWFYSYSGEISYFDYKDKRMHCPTFNDQLRKVKNKNSILNGLFIEDDTLYTFDYVGETYKINLQDQSVSMSYPKDSGVIIIEYSNKHHIFGHRSHSTEDCFLLLEKDNEEVRDVFSNLSTSISSLPSFSKYGDYYFISLHGYIYSFHPRKGVVSRYKIRHSTQSVYIDKDGLLWVGAYQNGVFGFNIKDGKLLLKYRFLNEYSVTSILKDRDGAMWFTTREKGVFYTPHLSISKLTPSTDHKVNTDNPVVSVTKGDSCIIFNNSKHEIIRLSINKDSEITKIGQETQGFKNLFSNGCSFHPHLSDPPAIKGLDTIKIIKPGSKLKIEDILHKGDKDWGLYIYSSNYCVFEKESNSFDKLLFTFAKVKDVRPRISILSPKLNVYYSGIHNLFYYDFKTKKHLQLAKTDQEKFEVSSISRFKGDTVWVATRNRGILLVHKDQILKEFNQKNGFDFGLCNYIKYDSSQLFISTSKGIFRLKEPFGKYGVAQLTKDHGLVSSEIYCSERFGKHLYLGTPNGLCIIDTSLFSKQITPPNCIIEQITYKDSSFYTSTLTVPYNFNGISISFSANSFSNAFSVPYRYRLSKSSEWTYTKDSKVTLSNLSPNIYTFEIQAANANKVWGDSTVLEINVTPPIWQAKWFIVLVIMVTIILTYFIYISRIKQLNKENRLKNDLLYAQNRALSAQMNPHFIFNSLNSITHGLFENNIRQSVYFIGKFAKLMRTVFENSEEIFVTLTEELQALNTYLELERVRLGKKLEYQIKTDSGIDKERVYVPALLLQPFAENAIWHGIAPKKEGGRVEILIKQQKDYLSIEIKDNGIGIGNNPLTKKKSMKRSAIRTTLERIKLIERLYQRKIKLRFTTLKVGNLTTGTSVLITIPLISNKPIIK